MHAKPIQQFHSVWTTPTSHRGPARVGFEAFDTTNAVITLSNSGEHACRSNLSIQPRIKITDVVPKPLIDQRDQASPERRSRARTAHHLGFAMDPDTVA
jgi:hypothetical protein